MGISAERAEELRTICRDIRRTILEMVYTAQSGHPGGSLSCVEILAALYLVKMHFPPENPRDPGRDRFILSKGHAAPALYAFLAYLGLFPRVELKNLRRFGGMLQGHPDMNGTPGIEMSSGPLGLGLSAGIGMALAARLDGRSYTTYVLLGDGELQEGIVWEAAMTASKYGLANLVAIVDHNGVQLDGTCEEIMPLGDIRAKFRSFGWQAVSCDGHSVPSILAALDEAAANHRGPAVIVAETVKGKGVSFMEGRSAWHGKTVDEDSYRKAASELGGVSLC